MVNSSCTKTFDCLLKYLDVPVTLKAVAAPPILLRREHSETLKNPLEPFPSTSS